MSSINNLNREIAIYKLEMLTIPYYLKNKLREYFYPKNIENVIEVYNRINRYCKIINEFGTPDFNEFATYDPKYDISRIEEIINNNNPDEQNSELFADLLIKDFNMDDIIKSAIPFFIQGLEFLRMSGQVSERIQPILDYYCLIQVTKGLFHLEFNLSEKTEFFNFHGLKKFTLEDKKYFGLIGKHGVFQAFNLLNSSEEINDDNLNRYSNGNETLDFVSLSAQIALYKIPSPVSGYSGEQSNSFVFSWLLSNLARYQPNLWNLILSGEDGAEVVEIRKFHRVVLPHTILRLLERYSLGY